MTYRRAGRGAGENGGGGGVVLVGCKRWFRVVLATHFMNNSRFSYQEENKV